MKHAATRELFDYWNRRRGRRWAPARSNIDPADIRNVLGDTFMLSADFVDGIRFRLAGTRVCALFAREIKGEDFNSLWNDTSQKHVEELLIAALSENVGAVAGVVGRTTDGIEVELEFLLLPLALDGRTRVRALGILAPLTPPYWLGERPVIQLKLRTLRHIGAEQSSMNAPLFGHVHEEPRARHGFLVYSGGRELQTDKPTSHIVGLPRFRTSPETFWAPRGFSQPNSRLFCSRPRVLMYAGGRLLWTEIPQTKSQSLEGMGTQNFTRIALVGGVFTVLGWLMAHLQSGSAEGFAGILGSLSWPTWLQRSWPFLDVARRFRWLGRVVEELRYRANPSLTIG